MNEFYRAKFNELFTEFNRYLAEHPAFAEKIPQGAEVILLDQRDQQYNNYALSGLRDSASKPPVIFVDVGTLAPVHSRLRNPKVVARPAAYAAR